MAIRVRNGRNGNTLITTYNSQQKKLQMMQTVLNIQSFFESNGITLVVFTLGMLVGLKITEIIITRNQSKN